MATDFSSSADLNVLSRLISEQIDPETVPPENWPAIIAAAGRHGLMPMLYWVVRDLKIFHNTPQNASLRKAALHTGLHHSLFEDASLRVERTLRAADISAVWLKGIILSRTLYPEPWLRPMSDLDVLIPAHQKKAAQEAITRIGFEPLQIASPLLPPGSFLESSVTHHQVLIGPPPARIHLELHYQILGHLPEEDLHWFLHQTETVFINDTPILCQTPEAALLYNIAHSLLQHGLGNTRLLWFLDLHLLITQKEIDWHLVVNQAVHFRWTHAVEQALALLKNLFGTPIPSFVFEYLRIHLPPDEDTGRVHRLAVAGSLWEKVSKMLRGLPPKEALQFAWRLVLPPPGYVRLRYGVKQGTSLVPWYLHRWRHQGREVLDWVRNKT